MSSAITFYFKDILPDYVSFANYLTDFEVVDLTIQDNQTFAMYLYRVLYRRYHNSNIQYDTPDAFKNDLANIIEDIFTKYQMQVKLAQKIHELTDEELLVVSTALANSANNPNTKVEDPNKPLEYVGAQAYTIANTSKLQGYLQALRLIPTKLVKELLLDCASLFKTIIPNQIYLYGGKKHDNN